MNTWALGQNGYANIYYSAGVKAMLGSWHNFLFLAADPGGLVSIDKPPLGLWLQVLSAKLFGFSPLPLLLPEALAGVAAVGALFLIVRPRFGALAAGAAALTLAGFPAFVAVSRDNNADTLLILLMTLACGAALRASETGRLRALLGSAVLVALAFNTKALAAYLVVPAIAAAYLCCAPGPLRRRAAHLLLAGAALRARSPSRGWSPSNSPLPASGRSSAAPPTTQSSGSTFGYNGFGRAAGRTAAPARSSTSEVLPAVERARAPLRQATATRAAQARARAPRRKLAETINAGPIAFGDSPGPLRLFGSGFGDQGAWMLAFALVGMLAIALTRPARRDPRLAGADRLRRLPPLRGDLPQLLQGDRPPLLPLRARPRHRRDGRRRPRRDGPSASAAPAAPAILAALTTAAVQVVLLHRAHYLLIWQAILIAARARRRLPPPCAGCARAGRGSRAVALLLSRPPPTPPAPGATRRGHLPGRRPACGPRQRRRRAEPRTARHRRRADRLRARPRRRRASSC